VNDAEEKQSIEPDDLKPERLLFAAKVMRLAYQARALLLKGLLSLQDIP
jgi:hypothetical protein